MNTVTINTNEYNRLVFLKTSKKQEQKSNFVAKAFGSLKTSFSKATSVAEVNKSRKAWRT